MHKRKLPEPTLLPASPPVDVAMLEARVNAQNRLRILRFRRWAALILVVIPIIAVCAAWSLTGSVQFTWAITQMAAFSTFGGGLALALSADVARKCRRRLHGPDFVRMICWIFVGAGLVSLCTFNPFALPMLVGGLLIVALTQILFAPPPTPRPGRCVECDYDLTGNTSGVCPECGAVIGCELPEPISRPESRSS